MEAFFDKCYEHTVHGEKNTLIQLGITTEFSLIGLGAPTHLFIENVAKLLGTTGIVPKTAPVANALGATAGNVVAKWITEILPVFEPGGISGYKIVTRDGIFAFEELEEARKAAIPEAMDAASKEAVKRGAAGALSVEYEIQTKMADTKDSEILLEEQIIAKAIGRIFTPEF